MWKGGGLLRSLLFLGRNEVRIEWVLFYSREGGGGENTPAGKKETVFGGRGVLPDVRGFGKRGIDVLGWLSGRETYQQGECEGGKGEIGCQPRRWQGERGRVQDCGTIVRSFFSVIGSKGLCREKLKTLAGRRSEEGERENNLSRDRVGSLFAREKKPVCGSKEVFLRIQRAGEGGEGGLPLSSSK